MRSRTWINSNNQNKQKTVCEICEIFWKIEEEEDLLNFNIGDVKIWQHLRLQIYYKITEQMELMGRPHDFRAHNNQFIRLVSLIRNSVLANPFFNLSKVDNIIFDHPRSKEVDGQFIDIYTDSLVKDYLFKKVQFNIIERSFDLNHKRKRKKYTFYFDFFILIGEIKARVFKRKLTTHEREKIEQVETRISQKFGVVISLLKWFEFEANKFHYIEKLFVRYFKLKKPTSIFVVVSYALGYVVHAAKRCGIEVVELQHGVISKYHLGYSYPNSSSTIDYFPHMFWCWGEYWRECCNYPISKNEIVVRGNVFFNIERNKYIQIKKVKKSILVISQGVVGEKIIRYIYGALPFLEGYQITIKLHPGEYDRYMNYNHMDSLIESSKVTIVEETNLYHLLAFSEYQVGVFSTAIYEGLSYACKTVLLNLPGIEYMDSLIEDGQVKLCSEPRLLRGCLDSFNYEKQGIPIKVEENNDSFFN